MTENEAIVTGIDGEFAVIRVKESPSSCGSCSAQGGCGKGAGPRSYSVRNTVNARVGDTVVFRVPDGAVLKAALLSYLLPLLFLFAGALGATQWISEGWPSVIGSVLGLAAGFVVLRIVARFTGRREPWLSLGLKRHVIHFDKEA